MHRHPKPTTNTLPVNHGTSSVLNMNDMRAMLPVPTYLYDHYHPMQQFVPTPHPHSAFYPLHPLSSYPSAHATPHSGPYIHQYSQAYAHYTQTQPHGAPQSQNSGYHSLNAASPAYFGVPGSNQVVGQGHHYQYPQHYHSPTQASTLTRGRDPLHIPVQVGTHGSPATQMPATATQPPSSTRLQGLNTDYDVSKTIVDGSNPMKPAPIHPSSTG